MSAEVSSVARSEPRRSGLSAPLWTGRRVLVWAIGFGAAAALPFAFKHNYYVGLLTTLVITLHLTLSLNFVIGRLGLFSLAHTAFFGAGAYATGILLQRTGISPWLCLPLSLLASASLAALVGWPLLRLKGLFLALATLALGLLAEVFAQQATEITGGAYGISGLPPLTILGTPVRGPLFYELALVSLLGVAVLFENLRVSRFGHAMTALRDNEVAAAAAGIDVAKVRLVGFVVSAAIAGLGGWLYAFYNQAVNPFILSLDLTFVWMFMVLIGGLGSMLGVAIGTAILSLGPELLGFATTQQVLVSGVLVLVVVLLAPKGLGGLIENARLRRKGEDA